MVLSAAQNKAFHGLATEVAKGDSKFTQMKTVITAYDWVLMSVVLDCVIQGIEATIGDTDWWELSITIGLHSFYVILALPIVCISSPRSWPWNLILLTFGFHEIDWYFRRLRSDEACRAMLKPYIDGDGNSQPKQPERKAVADLHANNMVEKSVGWIQTFPTSLMVIFKVCCELQELRAGNTCSLSILTRAFIVVLGLGDCIGATVCQDLASMSFLKAQRFKYFVDSGYRGVTVKGSTLNLPMKVAIYLFHSAFIVLRFWSFIFYFLSSWCMVCLYYFYLLATSWFHCNWMKPGYENPPSGIPTTTSKILEIFSRTICWRNLHFMHVGIQGMKSTFGFFLLIIIQHVVPLLFFWLNISDTTLMTQIAPNNSMLLLNSNGSCDDTEIRTLIFSVVNGLQLQLNIPIPEEFNMMTVLFINIPFFTFIICGGIYFLLLWVFELNDDAFPPQTAMFLWEKKLLDSTKYGSFDFWWIQEMLLLTILPESDFYKYLNRKDKREEFIQKAVKSVSDEQGNDKEKAISLAEQSVRPVNMRGQVVGMVNFAHNNRFPLAHKKVVFYFCQHFEEIMEGMNSHRIARICRELNVSSYIQLKIDMTRLRRGSPRFGLRCKHFSSISVVANKIDHSKIDSISQNVQ